MKSWNNCKVYGGMVYYSSKTVKCVFLCDSILHRSIGSEHFVLQKTFQTCTELFCMRHNRQDMPHIPALT